MKRSGYNSNSNNNGKKSRGDEFNDEPSFEEELMMMEESELAMEFLPIDAADTDDAFVANLPQRWSRPAPSDEFMSGSTDLGIYL